MLELSRIHLTQETGCTDPNIITLDASCREELREGFAKVGRYKDISVSEENSETDPIFVDPESTLGSLLAMDKDDPPSEVLLRNTLAMLGCARGLAETLLEAQDAMKHIHWALWKEERF